METAVRRQFFTRDRDFYRRFFRLLFYIALQNVIVTSVSLADNVMLGSYSQEALAGVAQVNQIQFLLQMVVSGAGEGMLVLTAQYLSLIHISFCHPGLTAHASRRGPNRARIRARARKSAV